MIYNDGKVTELKAYLFESPNQPSQYDKEVFIYDGNKLKEWIDYYKEDNNWVYDYKNTYSYTGDLITKEDKYSYYETWEFEESTHFTYNENEYLTQVSTEDFVITLSYEEGNGNFDRFLNPYSKVYNNPSPKSSKKQSKFIQEVMKKYSFKKN